MANILIQDVPEDVINSLRNIALSAGVSPDVWLRDYLIKSIRAVNPASKPAYVLSFRSRQGGSGRISRTYGTHNMSSQANLANPRQSEAFERAQELIQRGNIGDNELAVQILKTAFEEVTEE